MTESLLKWLIPFAVGYGIAAFNRWDARRIERNRNAPYRDFAHPVFVALHDPNIETVTLIVKRSDDGRGWEGHRYTTPKEPQ